MASGSIQAGFCRDADRIPHIEDNMNFPHAIFYPRLFLKTYMIQVEHFLRVGLSGRKV